MINEYDDILVGGFNNKYWLVVWNLFYDFPNQIGDDDPI